MRNKKAENFGVSRECIPFWGDPSSCYDSSSYDEDWGFEGWYDDGDYDPDSYRTKLVPNITNSNRDSIIMALASLGVNMRTSHLFEDIIIGPFVIVVETRPLLDKYVLGDITTYKTMSLNIVEFIPEKNYYSQVWLNVPDDSRFNMKKWARRFEQNVVKDFTFDELIDLIQLCKRLDRLHTFY
jgi:hypothetical protein